MIERMTVAELFRALVWALLLFAPLLMAFAAGDSKHEDRNLPFFGAFFVQCVALIAAYVAGGVR